jgi:hypothetical protein
MHPVVSAGKTYVQESEESYLKLTLKLLFDTVYSYQFLRYLNRLGDNSAQLPRRFDRSDKSPTGDYYSTIPPLSPCSIFYICFRRFPLDVKAWKLRYHEPSTVCGGTLGDYEDEQRLPLVRKAVSFTWLDYLR